ncbi:MAG: methyltransferase domain-containing protein [Pseudomonadales bacterium]|nr:methyltransferase domain-containing protein [Pseudomonadales bacterium]
MSATLSEASLDSLREIRSWFGSSIGIRVLQTEQAILDQLLSGFFGYHLLQASILNSALYGSSPIQNKFSLGLDGDHEVPVVARATELPFENDSIDVILLHHLLDFMDSPLDTLREITRVSLPMGYLVVVGFNPLSTWGLWKLPAAMMGRAPWTGKFIRPGRLMDWLNVLNFKIDRAQYCIYGLPFVRKKARIPDHSKELSRTLNLPFGAAYIIVARKQVSTMTPIRPVWRPAQSFGRLSVVSD